MRFYTTMQLGPTQSVTPEGYLVCHDVPISRTGELLYALGETPIMPGPDGIARVVRDDAEVFHERTIASFIGKPVTDEHPPVDVSPSTWNLYARGTVVNVRRGTGDQADLLLADLLITNPDTISDIRNGKREVSCGYNADYTQDSPGKGRQSNIIGNHVALVKVGRAGSRCAIGDSGMNATLKQRIALAMASGDDAQLDALMREGAAAPAATGSGVPVIHIHNSTHDRRARTGDEGEEGEAASESDPLDELRDMIKGLVERIGALEAAHNENAETHEDAGDDLIKVDGDGGTDTANDDEPEPQERTGDSGAGLRTALADTKSRAEILSPGIQLPTLDGPQTVKKVRTTIRDIRARALDAAYGTDKGKQVIDRLSGVSTKPDFSKMPTKDARMLFTAASETMRVMNNDAGNHITFHSLENKSAMSPAEINKRSREVWSGRTGQGAAR